MIGVWLQRARVTNKATAQIVRAFARSGARFSFQTQAHGPRGLTAPPPGRPWWLPVGNRIEVRVVQNRSHTPPAKWRGGLNQEREGSSAACEGHAVLLVNRSAQRGGALGVACTRRIQVGKRGSGTRPRSMCTHGHDTAQRACAAPRAVPGRRGTRRSDLAARAWRTRARGPVRSHPRGGGRGRYRVMGKTIGPKHARGLAGAALVGLAVRQATTRHLGLGAGVVRRSRARRPLPMAQIGSRRDTSATTGALRHAQLAWHNRLQPCRLGITCRPSQPSPLMHARARVRRWA